MHAACSSSSYLHIRHRIQGGYKTDTLSVIAQPGLSRTPAGRALLQLLRILQELLQRLANAGIQRRAARARRRVPARQDEAGGCEGVGQLKSFQHDPRSKQLACCRC